MLNVGDLRQFARAFGKWLYGLDPNLDATSLQAAVQKFAMSAPIGVADGSALSVEEFCSEAAKGYASEGEASDTMPSRT